MRGNFVDRQQSDHEDHLLLSGERGQLGGRFLASLDLGHDAVGQALMWHRPRRPAKMMILSAEEVSSEIFVELRL